MVRERGGDPILLQVRYSGSLALKRARDPVSGGRAVEVVRIAVGHLKRGGSRRHWNPTVAHTCIMKVEFGVAALDSGFMLAPWKLPLSPLPLFKARGPR